MHASAGKLSNIGTAMATGALVGRYPAEQPTGGGTGVVVVVVVVVVVEVGTDVVVLEVVVVPGAEVVVVAGVEVVVVVVVGAAVEVVVVVDVSPKTIVRAAQALRALTSPLPKTWSRPGCPRSSAVSNMAEETWVTVACGYRSQRSAATPDTCGVAMEVPSSE